MKLFILILCGLLIISIPCTIIAQDQYNVRLKAASTGKILRQQETKDLPGRYSNNGKYRCSFEIGHVTDEIRELGNFRFYENNALIFTMDKAPGSDMYISNSGYLAFIDMKEHFRNRIGIHFYSRSGQYLFSETYEGAFQFGFSSTGNKFGVGTTKELNMISLPEKHVASFEKGYHFDISGDEVFTAVACENKINVYRYDSPVLDIRTGMPHKRDIKISTQNDIIAVIGKKNLKIYSLSDGDLRFEDRLNGPGSFRELEISGNELIAGINHKSRGLSKGSLRKYDLTGYGYINEDGLSKNIPTFDKQQDLTKKNTAYPSIPWPFIPFDELHTVWNYYEQHMGSTIPYLHQGLDLIVPMNEPTYAVEAGIVKCVLTLGGASYWRLATSETQVSGESEGWLYAHLVESSIAVDVGDTVDVHDYLGNIIRWSSDWGHIHFARIKDWGTVWRYNDDEWGIVYNPLLALDPNTDTIAPELKNVISGSKIVFYKNRLDTILDPDSLYGEIDIVIKVEDYIGDAEWTIPADITYYTIKRISDASVLVPRTIGHVLNHEYDFYASSNYYDYAPLIYKVNDDLQPSSWMDN
ncbi:MAG: hypothetical protein GY863_17550, partial [bacterium]|nr:hypothetical protein [bacterium]